MKNETSHHKPHWERSPEGAPNEWEGTCEKCGETVEAFDLEYRLRPFGKGEWRVCKRGCAAESRPRQYELLVLLREMRKNGEL